MRLTSEQQQRRQRIYQLFRQARRMDAARQQQFLSQACQADRGLHDEVLRRLQADQRAQDRSSHNGSAFEDQYELGDVIGRGGMGVVYRARQKSPNRWVAIKMLLSGPFASEEDIQRFLIEGEATADLDHPSIVPIYAVGRDAGRYWIVMKLIEGQTLQGVIDEAALSPREAANYTRTVAEAIAYAHGRGVIHRDLKPANILLDQQKQVVVTDFGLAKRMTAEQHLSITGQVFGSPGYMSPEQALGNHKDVSAATDIYALGAILYALLTGSPPVRAENLAQAMRQMVEAEPRFAGEASRQVPLDLQTICLKCLQKDPQRRYRTAQEVADELGRFLAGEPIEARPLSRAARSWRWCQRNPWIAGLTALFVVSLVFGSGGSTYFAAQANRRAVEANRNAGLYAEASAQADKRAAEATAAAEEARRQVYDNQIALAEVALETGDIDHAWSLLNTQWPKPGEPDLRGFDWYCLARLLNSEQTAFQGHRGRIPCLAASPREPWIASGGFDTDVRLWNLQTGRCLAVLPGHTEVVIALAVSPDSCLLASGSGDTTIKLWDVRNLEKPQEIAVFRQGTPVHGLDFSPDGRWLASSGYQDVRLWQLSDLRRAAILKGHTHQIRCVRFSPDSALLASGSSDHTIRIWDVERQKESQEIALEGHAGIVHSLDFSPDGQLLASGSWDHTIKLWNTNTWQPKATLETDRMIRSVRFSDDGRRLVSGGEDRMVRIWDVAAAREIAALPGHAGMIEDVLYCVDGSLVSVGESPRIASDESAHGSSAEIKLWDEATRQARVPLPPWSERASVAWRTPARAWQVRFVDTEAGRQILASLDDGHIAMFDLESRTQIGELPGHTMRVRTMDVSADGDLLVTSSEDHSARVWHLPTRQMLQSWTRREISTEAIAFSPHGKTFAMAHAGNLISLRDTTSGGELQSFAGHEKMVSDLAFAPDGTRIASASSDGTARVWDVASGSELHQCHGHSGAVHAVAYSPDGTLLATAGADRTIRIWNASNGKQLRKLTGHLNQVRALDFSPVDSSRLATASSDKTVKLWNVTTGHELITLRGHLDELTDAKFSPDGRDLAVSVQRINGNLLTGQVVVWRCATVDELLQACEQRARRDWRQTEDQIALALCCWNLARGPQGEARARDLLTQGRNVLVRLAAESRIPPQQAQWVAHFDQALKESSVPEN